MSQLRILVAAAEVAPFAKAGGLADVAGTLPKALLRLGADVRVVMPKYRQIDEKKYGITNTGMSYTVFFDGIEHRVRIFSVFLPNSNTPVYLLDHPHYEGVGDIYYQDVRNTAEQQQMQVERFLFFSAAVRDMLPILNWWPDVVHANDWHTALIPVLLAHAAHTKPAYENIATIYTIHNLALQGWVSYLQLLNLLGLRPDHHVALTATQDDGLNLAACAIAGADALSTVSPSYAKEILTPEYGAGLERLLAARKDDLVGIVNGIDVDRFNPATDPALVSRYDIGALDQKRANVDALKNEFHLQTDGPIFGVVSRLTSQKGLDLFVSVVPKLASEGVGVVLLGAGDPEIEKQLLSLAHKYPKSVGLRIGFDADLAQRIYAGSDMFVMPSRFEPCGLGQLIAMRYGTLPIVRATGGLRDTVHEGGDGTGFVFERFSSSDLLAACLRALDLWGKPEEWRAAQERAMKQDLSWEKAARAYLRLYERTQHRHATK